MHSFLVGNNVDHLTYSQMESMISIKNLVMFLSMTLYKVSAIDQIENVVNEICKMVTVPGQDFENYYSCCRT